MSDKKVDKSSGALEGKPLEDLETESLEEVHGGVAQPSFATVTINGIGRNDSPIKR